MRQLTDIKQINSNAFEDDFVNLGPNQLIKQLNQNKKDSQMPSGSSFTVLETITTLL